jgi:Icc-related predicted phosphoesterase
MKLLLFSDLHCDTKKAKRLVELSRDVDVVVGAGDFGNLRRGLDRSIDVLRSIDKPAVVVPGNSESDDELREACRQWPSAHVLHGSGVTIKGVQFFGIGGGIPVTPFGSWSFDFTEEQAAEFLVDCPEECVLVTHSPPQGAVDVSSRGVSLGSVTVGQVIESRRPRLVVCGHIHESSGKHEFIGSTPVVNAGPDGILWSL